MDENRQQREYSRRVRNARKAREEEIKREAENEIKEKLSKIKRGWKWIKRYRYLIALISTPSVILILIALIVLIMVIYCSDHKVECGLEVGGEAVKEMISK